MKRVFMSLALACLSICLWAAPDIQFTLMPSQSSNLDKEQLEALDTKVHKILVHNNVLTADKYGLFGLQADLEVVKKSDTGKPNKKVVTGQLTLSAKNILNNEIYYSETFPMEVEERGAGIAAASDLIKSIDVKSALFTRFLRRCGGKVEDYYAENCDLILTRAFNLFKQEKYDDAEAYLCAVPEVAPCYDDAAYLIEKIIAIQKGEPLVERDTVYIDRIIVDEKPAPNPEPVVEPAPEPQPAPVVAPKYQVSMSNQEINFKLLKCVGSKIQRSITLYCEIENVTDRNWNGYYSGLEQAFTPAGKELGDFSGNGYYNFPSHVKTTRLYTIKNVPVGLEMMQYVKLSVSHTTVELRDVPVQWED